jgi:hypothetical protein
LRHQSAELKTKLGVHAASLSCDNDASARVAAWRGAKEVGVMINGNSVGIDTDHQLNQLAWQKIQNQRQGAQFAFAGRYFFQTPNGNPNPWHQGETAGLAALNANLEYVAPFQGPGPNPNVNKMAHRRLAGEDPVTGLPVDDEDTVRGWGNQDASEVCSKIAAAVNSNNNPLHLPSSRRVIVYLDVEYDVDLSADYWYGWASTVWWFAVVTSTIPFLHFPFYPGIYCTTTAPGKSLYNRVPNQSIQDALNASVNNLASRCYGIWASNPELNGRFAPGYQPDWTNRFAKWQQTVQVTFFNFKIPIDVPVRLWQYAAMPGPQNFNTLHVDLDETAPLDADKSPGSNAVNWMLTIN